MLSDFVQPIKVDTIVTIIKVDTIVTIKSME